LGNLLLQDEGVGVRAVRELKAAGLPGVLMAEVGTAVLDCLHLLEWADRVLVLDAVKAGGPPGTIYAFGLEDAEAGERPASLHEVTLMAAFRFLPQEKRPAALVLGVEPQTIDVGLELTPPVAAALPELFQAARKVTAAWRRRESPNLAADAAQPARPGRQAD
jgi:hydrogenase maturation protease